MNITFMIGNGFDISMGLKTKYSDFYPYFLANADAGNLLRKKLEDLGDKAYEDWADLESALGIFTDEIFEADYEKFVLDKIEMDDLLVDYLKEEQAKFVLDEFNISLSFFFHFFIFTLLNFNCNPLHTSHFCLLDAYPFIYTFCPL